MKQFAKTFLPAVSFFVALTFLGELAFSNPFNCLSLLTGSFPPRYLRGHLIPGLYVGGKPKTRGINNLEMERLADAHRVVLGLPKEPTQEDDRSWRSRNGDIQRLFHEDPSAVRDLGAFLGSDIFSPGLQIGIRYYSAVAARRGLVPYHVVLGAGLTPAKLMQRLLDHTATDGARGRRARSAAITPQEFLRAMRERNPKLLLFVYYPEVQILTGPPLITEKILGELAFQNPRVVPVLINSQGEASLQYNALFGQRVRTSDKSYLHKLIFSVPRGGKREDGWGGFPNPFPE